MIVEVSARKFVVPYECPCCGAVPDTELTVAITRVAERPVAADSARAIDFPYCKQCLSHVAAHETAGVASAAVLVVGMIAATIVAITVKLIVGLLVFVAAIPVAVAFANQRRKRAKASCGPSCAGSARAVTYYGWSGAVSAFSFESLVYAARFAEQNQPALSNVSAQLRQLLEGHRVARLQVPTPAAAMVVPPPATARDWIARIERSAGRLERRNTLKRALDAITDPGERRDVIATASRIELAPIVEKVRALGTAAAKRQELQRAIADVRADNLPDELQTAEIDQLESRLRELG